MPYEEDKMIPEIELKHHVRFLLVKLLIKKDVNDETIIKLLSVLPDFNESVTQYQLDHLRKQFKPVNIGRPTKGWESPY